jgi:mRNA interferase YafQ
MVIENLAAGEKLKPKYRDDQLSGNWKGHRDCHIESDWILIYRIEFTLRSSSPLTPKI